MMLPFRLLSALTILIILAGCFPRQRQASPNEPVLGDLLVQRFQQAGDFVSTTSTTDTLQIGDDCLLEVIKISLPEETALRLLLDSLRDTTIHEFQRYCTEEASQQEDQGTGFYSEDLARMDDRLVALSVRRTLIPPGGKGHPTIQTFHFDPVQQKLLAFPELFKLDPEQLYPLLRRLVLAKIEADGLLDDAARILFDDSQQGDAEVLSAGLVTKEGLVFSFGPGQCRQLYWATPIEVTLTWDTQL
jgi:hypothetical protein